MCLKNSTETGKTLNLCPAESARILKSYQSVTHQITHEEKPEGNNEISLYELKNILRMKINGKCNKKKKKSSSTVSFI